MMTSEKPYLIRGIYEWICDNKSTPYIYANTELNNLKLPEGLLNENPLVLNISPAASMNLEISNEAISFTARFSGNSFDLYIPINAVLAIISKETGQGLTFPEDENISAPGVEEEVQEKNSKKTGLKLVK